MRYASLWMALVLVSSDMLCLVGANLLALEARSLVGDGFSVGDYLQYLPTFFFFLLLYLRRGLYTQVGYDEPGELYDLTTTTSTGFLIIAALTYVLKVQVTYSRPAFGLTWLLALGLVPFGRFVVRAVSARAGLWGIPVVVLGERGDGLRVVRHFRRQARIGLRPVALFNPAGRKAPSPGRQALPLADLKAFCHKYNIRTGLAVCSTLEQMHGIRQQYREVFERIVVINSDASSQALSGVTGRDLGSTRAWIMKHNLLSPWSQALKRTIDLALSGLGLLLLALPFAVLALLIVLDGSGGVFYRQVRVGRGGRQFKMFKFRTMHPNADAVLKQFLAANPAARAEYETYQKLKKDPRITRIGRFLRRYSIDELPQLWNVFVGEMSLVGPRPIMLHQVELYGASLSHYHRVTPGITGIWQVSGRNRLSFEQRAECDYKYVMSWSVWLDIYLMVRTVWTVLRHDGAG